MGRTRRKIRIRTSILANFLLGVALVSISLLALQFYFEYRTAIQSIGRVFQLNVKRISSDMQYRDRLARATVEDLALLDFSKKITVDPIPLNLIRTFSSVLQRDPSFYSLYLGLKDGTLLELVNLRSSRELGSFYHSPKNARWMVIRIFEKDGERIRQFDFFDKDFVPLSQHREPSDYRADRRPWYRLALGSHEVVRSDPYLFSNLKQMGITYSKELGDGTVLALDLTERKLGELLRALKPTASSQLVLLDEKGTVIAQSDKISDAFLRYFTGNDNREKGKRLHTYEEKSGRTMLALLTPLDDTVGRKLWLGLVVDRDDAMAPYIQRIYYALSLALIVLLLALPLLNHLVRRIVRPIHALMRENEKIKERRFQEVQPVDTEIIELDQLSRSLLEMATSIQVYQEKQKELLDSFIRLIADAIDAKSPYTGGHCKRVPVIAEMLLKEVSRSEEATFSHFRMESEEEWEAFERGAWLHDCGKITTPEYVVDKATKLETIYNRIHEIRTRFEVLWRDEEIRYHKELSAGMDPEEAERRLIRAHAELLEDFDFIARVNIGGEFLDEESKERVRSIARRTWLRHFDNRLGLSPQERKRMSDEPVHLPVEERLLADRPEHRIERTGYDPESYRNEGFTMEVPELLYNRGELHNLLVEKGTLTEEERYKIQEHIVMTIRMLERLPWPEDMRNVPRFAGTHHERLDGKGYPRSLTGSELSIPERVMGIADVFEALTASDRPYKEGKKLSVSLEIMVQMAMEGHLDPDLLALFIRSKTYRNYARSYLESRQLDEVDEEALLRELEGISTREDDS